MGSPLWTGNGRDEFDPFVMFHKKRIADALRNGRRYSYQACHKCLSPITWLEDSYGTEKVLCPEHGESYQFRVISQGQGGGPVVDHEVNIREAAPSVPPLPGRHYGKYEGQHSADGWTPEARAKLSASLKAYWARKNEEKLNGTNQ